MYIQDPIDPAFCRPGDPVINCEISVQGKKQLPHPTETEAVPPRFNDYFASEEEARLIWEMYNMALYGIDPPVRPFPGDRPDPTPFSQASTREMAVLFSKDSASSTENLRLIHEVKKYGGRIVEGRTGDLL